jgi:small ligand-binding sensory domain FIST
MMQPNLMQWSSALSTRPGLEAAIQEVVDRALATLQGAPTIGFMFISTAFASEFGRVMPLLQAKLPGIPILGCGGSGVIGMDPARVAQEIEDDVVISLTLASLPDVQAKFFHIDTNDLPDLDGAPNAWIDLIGVDPVAAPQFIVLMDPASNGIGDLLSGLDYAYPNLPKIGGLASTGQNSGLFCIDRHYRYGAVGVALTGNIVMDTIVAQGCRPVGEPYWVTASERNIILGLRADGSDLAADTDMVPLEMLRQVVDELEEVDQELAKNALFVGIAQNAFKQTLSGGDFLVRNLLGFDPQRGALAIGDRIRSGQRIQFHLRDASASAEDLEALLQQYQAIGENDTQQSKPFGALMFTCLGRGIGLYDEANFDSGIFSEYLPRTPIAGLFCNGEIGPVGGSTFLHGYTSVFGILRPRQV